MCPAILYTAVMHSATYSLASTTLTGLGLSDTLSRASTHFLEGPNLPTKILEGGMAPASMAFMVPTPVTSLILFVLFVYDEIESVSQV